jgi:elongation factor G
VKVLAGHLSEGSSWQNTSRGTEERISALHLLDGKDTTQVSEVNAGDIAAVLRLKDTYPGDTLCLERGQALCDRQVHTFTPINFPEPMVSYAIKPASQQDEKKIWMGLQKLCREDPAIRVLRNASGEMVICGMRQFHLEMAILKLKYRYELQVELSRPRIPYLETISRKVEATYRHKKMTGGPGQFAKCTIIVEPLPRGMGYQFVDQITGGSINKQYRPAVNAGIAEAASSGVLAGYPVVDFKVTLSDGKQHPVDSSELAFKIAGSMAFKKACACADAKLLEPVMCLELLVPIETTGDVVGAINRQRGKITAMDGQLQEHLIKSLLPMAEMPDFELQLSAITQGRGTFSMQFSHYQETPAQLQAKVIAHQTGKI